MGTQWDFTHSRVRVLACKYHMILLPSYLFTLFFYPYLFTLAILATLATLAAFYPYYS